MAYFWIALALAAVDWLMVIGKWPWMRTITKPAPLVVLLIWTLSTENWQQVQSVLLAAALLFAVIGDVMTMPKVNRFLYGVLAYVFSNAVIILSLNTNLPPFNLSTILFAGVILLVAVRLQQRFEGGIIERKREIYRLPSLVINASMSLMVFSGLATLAKDSWSPSAALAAAAGTVLLMIANMILMWVATVEILPYNALIKKIPFHLGYIFIALGTIIHLS